MHRDPTAEDERVSDKRPLNPPPDTGLIAISDDEQVAYWTRKWNISRDELAAAVDAVGDRSVAVARHLGRSEYD